MKKRSQLKLIIASVLVVITMSISYVYLPPMFADTVYPLKYENWIRQYSTKYGVDPALVTAVIFQESRFNPNANSPAGAQGLMQFMPGTAATMARETGRSNYNIYDPETSIEFGSAHLRDLLVKYNGNLDAALAGYNAGTGNADRWVRLGILDRIPFAETNNYVKKVKNYQQVYTMMYPEQLGIKPPLVVEGQNDQSALRGFVWSQVFSNVFTYFTNRET